MFVGQIWRRPKRSVGRKRSYLRRNYNISNSKREPRNLHHATWNILNHSSQVVPNFGALRSIHHVQGFFLPNLKGQMILVFLSWYHCRLCQPAHPRPKGDQENIFTKLFVSCDLSKIFFLILQTSTFVFFFFFFQ